MYLTPEFALGFFFLFSIYWGFEGKVTAQNRILLLFSALFYASLDTLMAIYLGVFILTVFFIANRIQQSNQGTQRAWLGFGLTTLAVYLISLKYYSPIRESLSILLPNASGWQGQLLSLNVLVPIGVSFYTFQAVALLVGCYRNDLSCRNLTLSETGLYLAFFPTVLAGPICRPELLLSQFRLTRRFMNPWLGLGLIARGMFKILVIANWLATTWVDPMFANPASFNGIELAIGAAAFSIQIYADFSGLTDLVRGLAWILGFRLPENFNLPYLASTPKEFWRRWHITLSRWIRDFIYIPLGGNRHGAIRTQINLMLAMLLSGAWHGAGWNYIIWGALHGGAIIITSLWPHNLAPPKNIQMPLTFVFVSFAWIFFRASDLSNALVYVESMLQFDLPFTYNIVGGIELLLGFFVIQLLVDKYPNWSYHLRELPWLVQVSGLAAIIWVSIELGPSGIPDFIYSKY